MKKTALISILLALILSLSSCHLTVSRLPLPDLDDPSHAHDADETLDALDTGTEKTFSKAGITLRLSDKFREVESQRGFDAYYTSDFCGVVVLKESFSKEEGLAEKSLEAYIKDVIENNGHKNIEPQNLDGLWFYVNYNNSSYRCVYSYSYKGADAFYIVQYIMNRKDEAVLKDVIHNWAKDTVVS